MPTKIEWCDETINPVRTKEGGWYCVKSSLGCTNCYAEKINKRFGDKNPYTKRESVELVLNKKALEKPLKWKKPKRIFIQDMSDLFLPSGEWFNQVQHIAHCEIIDLIKETPHHTYIMLTKHPQEMMDCFMGVFGDGPDFWHEPLHFDGGKPLTNLWLGVTAENQKMFDERWAILSQIPAAVKFVSLEPFLSGIDLKMGTCSHCQKHGKQFHITHPCEVCGRIGGKNPDWVILGGESGHNARPMGSNWARSVRDQCFEAGVPFFFKQWGEWGSEHQTKYPAIAIAKEKARKNNSWKNIMCSVNTEYYYKVGKKAAGRELDGRIWDEMPGGIK